MIYATMKLPKGFHQRTLEEFLFSNSVKNDYVYNSSETATRTYEMESASLRFKERFPASLSDAIYDHISSFVEAQKCLIDSDLHEHYYSFKIPKKSGGLRQIDAPDTELKTALYELISILRNDFGALYHSAAYAYVEGRSTIDAVKKHQRNDSHWFLKLDFSNFFGSTTMEFVIHMLEHIYPFSEFMKDRNKKEVLRRALSLGFLDGVLPQGTPLSPMLTNLIMIPIDYRISKELSDMKSSFVYTRYADDILISSKYDFRFKTIEEKINEILASFDAPFKIKPSKTRYGSRSGSNWNLGVMLNKDNKITIGNKKERQFKSMLFSYGMDKKNGKGWDLSDVQHMEGLRSYYRMVEPQEIDAITTHISNKVGLDIIAAIKADLSM